MTNLKKLAGGIYIALIALWLLLVINSCSTIQKSGKYRVESIKEDTIQFSKYTWLYRDSTPVRGKYLMPGPKPKLKEIIHIYIIPDSVFTDFYLIQKRKK